MTDIPPSPSSGNIEGPSLTNGQVSGNKRSADEASIAEDSITNNLNAASPSPSTERPTGSEDLRDAGSSPSVKLLSIIRDQIPNKVPKNVVSIIDQRTIEIAVNKLLSSPVDHSRPVNLPRKQISFSVLADLMSSAAAYTMPKNTPSYGEIYKSAHAPLPETDDITDAEIQQFKNKQEAAKETLTLFDTKIEAVDFKIRWGWVEDSDGTENLKELAIKMLENPETQPIGMALANRVLGAIKVPKDAEPDAIDAMYNQQIELSQSLNAQGFVVGNYFDWDRRYIERSNATTDVIAPFKSLNSHMPRYNLSEVSDVRRSHILGLENLLTSTIDNLQRAQFPQMAGRLEEAYTELLSEITRNN